MTNTPAALTLFEKDVIALILTNECPHILGDIALLSVRHRENTGSGAYIYFDYSCDIVRKTTLPPHLGSSIAIQVEGVVGGAGALLFFRQQKIDMLEFFSYGSNWPGAVKGYTLTTI